MSTPSNPFWAARQPRQTATSVSPPQKKPSRPINVIVGQSVTYKLDAKVKTVSIADSDVADVVVAGPQEVLVNGKLASESITEPVFFTVMMKFWLGPNPADWQLKDALLGQAKS